MPQAYLTATSSLTTHTDQFGKTSVLQDSKLEAEADKLLRFPPKGKNRFTGGEMLERTWWVSDLQYFFEASLEFGLNPEDAVFIN